MNGKEILETLKQHANPNEYNHYLSKITYDSNKSSESRFIFLAKNIFILNWMKRNYKERMLEIAKSAGVQPEIIFTLESNSQNERDMINEDSQKKYAIKNMASMANADYSFENFIVGECNEFAYKMAKSVVETSVKYNPLLIYGNTGLGKTHLLHAICSAVYIKNPNARVISIPAEAMFNEYRHRIANKNMDQFRERFRSCDYLLIDDIQFLSATEKFQEEFFNTFNDIVNLGGQIVLTSDKPPKQIKIEGRLKSRFIGGMMAKIESPQIETRIDIIKQKCRINDIQLDLDIIEFIATRMKDNIREIEGMIANLYGKMNLLKIPITLDIIKTMLKDRESERRAVGLGDIVNIVATEYNIKPSDIRTKVRGKKSIARARKIVAFLAKEITFASFPDIAMELNLKGHSAVSKQIKIMASEVREDSKLRMEIENLKSKLGQRSLF